MNMLDEDIPAEERELPRWHWMSPLRQVHGSPIGEMMQLAELLPHLHALNRAQKLHVMQFLVSELAQQEGEPVTSGLTYPVWSPHDAFDAANSMLRVLKADEHA
jgi:hypothetical protein